MIVNHPFIKQSIKQPMVYQSTNQSNTHSSKQRTHSRGHFPKKQVLMLSCKGENMVLKLHFNEMCIQRFLFWFQNIGRTTSAVPKQDHENGHCFGGRFSAQDLAPIVVPPTVGGTAVGAKFWAEKRPPKQGPLLWSLFGTAIVVPPSFWDKIMNI